MITDAGPQATTNLTIDHALTISAGYLYGDFHKPRTQKNGTMLWMIGDSNIRQLYNQVINGPFCERFFGTCDHNYNWIYEVSRDRF